MHADYVADVDYVRQISSIVREKLDWNESLRLVPLFRDTRIILVRTI